jgi:hypothetical protein
MAAEKDHDGVEAITTVMGALKPLDAKTRLNVLDYVTKQLGIEIERSAASPVSPLQPLPPAPVSGMAPQTPDTDIRTFAAAKQPQTLNEKVAVVAYFLAHLSPAAERRDYITPDDIKPYFIQANFEFPTGPMSMALTNAKNAGYLNALERGQYKLNSVGHNLVAHKLPGRDTPKKRTAKPIRKGKR